MSKDAGSRSGAVGLGIIGVILFGALRACSHEGGEIANVVARSVDHGAPSIGDDAVRGARTTIDHAPSNLGGAAGDNREGTEVVSDHDGNVLGHIGQEVGQEVVQQGVQQGLQQARQPANSDDSATTTETASVNPP